MSWRTRMMLRESAMTAVAFTVACYSYYFFTFWGVQDQYVPSPLRDYLAAPLAHVEILMIGVLFGGMIGVINRLAESPRLRDRSVGHVILFRTFAYLFTTFAVTVVVTAVFATFLVPLDDLREIMASASARTGIALAVWMILVVVGINLMLEVSRLIGPGNLPLLLVGRYRRPRVEDRVFLFMDLKGSTGFAEQLGHQRYSQLLQECYHALTPVALEHEGAIYQYVGDEVIMSWPVSVEAEKASVDAFFAYEESLQSKASLFQSQFGALPEFRGGIAAGPATAIEVGDLKREIVYHGDVLNTASRLLDLCKSREERLVVSGAVGDVVTTNGAVRASWRGEVLLRGKQAPVSAVSLEQRTASA